LLVLGPEASPLCLSRLSLLRIRDFMLPTISAALAHLRLLPSLLERADPPLASHIPPHPFYALSTTLTLFAHDVESYPSIARLFDFLLAAPAPAATYFFAAIIRYRRDELLAFDSDDVDMLHFTLSKLPPILDFEALIEDTMHLLHTYPPSTLGRPWRNVSSHSVLRTVPDATSLQVQSLDLGEAWLAKQSAEALRQERRAKMLVTARRLAWKWRRHVVLGTAISAALLAIWWGNRDAMGRWFGQGNIWITVRKSLGIGARM
jgi:hypothetical protein